MFPDTDTALFDTFEDFEPYEASEYAAELSNLSPGVASEGVESFLLDPVALEAPGSPLEDTADIRDFKIFRLGDGTKVLGLPGVADPDLFAQIKRNMFRAEVALESAGHSRNLGGTKDIEVIAGDSDRGILVEFDPAKFDDVRLLAFFKEVWIESYAYQCDLSGEALVRLARYFFG